MKLIIISGCIILSILLIISLFIFFLKLKVSIVVENNITKVYLWKIKVFDSGKRKKPALPKNVDKDKEFEKKFKFFKYIFNSFNRILDDKKNDLIFIIKYVKKTVEFKSVDFSLDYGLGNAALTGLSGGIVWGLISNVSGFIGKFIDIKSFTNVAVKPHYTEKVLDYRLKIIIYVSIINLLKTYRHIKRFKKTLEGRG